MHAKKPQIVKQEIFPAGDLRNSLAHNESIRSEPVFDMWPLSSFAMYRATIFKNGKAQHNDERNGFYWKDNNNLGGHGPFTGEYMATEHYKAYIIQLRAIVKMKEDGITPQSAKVLQMSEYRNKFNK